MNQYVVIVGLNEATTDPVTKVVKTAEQNYQGEQDYLQSYFAGHIGVPTSQVFTTRWNRDVFTEVMAKFPVGNIRILAHSFGGQKGIEVAAALIAAGRVVEQLILFDPVDYNNPNVVNTKGFAVPVGVARCRCWHRSNASMMPFSGGLIKPTPTADWVDTVYVPKTADPHGECVYFADAITEAKMTITVPVPAPVPTPALGRFGSPFFVAVKYLTLIQDHADAGVVNWDESSLVAADDVLNTLAHQIEAAYKSLPPVKEIP